MTPKSRFTFCVKGESKNAAHRGWPLSSPAHEGLWAEGPDLGGLQEQPPQLTAPQTSPETPRSHRLDTANEIKAQLDTGSRAQWA